jgi:putative sporulation protein YtaF
MNVRLVASLLLGISTNIDNFGVGLAYGTNRIRIGHWPNVLIATFNAGATGISMLAGTLIAKFLSASVSNATGAGIIAILGVYYLYDTYFGLSSKGKVVSSAPATRVQEIMKRAGFRAQHTRDVSRNEAFALAVGLSISNLTLGVGAGLAGFDIRIMVAIMFVFSWLMIVLGDLFGRISAMALPEKWASTISGLMLIGLGIHDLFFSS